MLSWRKNGLPSVRLMSQPFSACRLGSLPSRGSSNSWALSAGSGLRRNPV
jgi:hypothetical protein